MLAICKHLEIAEITINGFTKNIADDGDTNLAILTNGNCSSETTDKRLSKEIKFCWEQNQKFLIDKWSGI